MPASNNKLYKYSHCPKVRKFLSLCRLSEFLTIVRYFVDCSNFVECPNFTDCPNFGNEKQVFLEQNMSELLTTDWTVVPKYKKNGNFRKTHCNQIIKKIVRTWVAMRKWTIKNNPARVVTFLSSSSLSIDCEIENRKTPTIIWTGKSQLFRRPNLFTYTESTRPAHKNLKEKG